VAINQASSQPSFPRILCKSMHGKNNIAIRSKRNNDDKNRARNFSEIISNVTRAHKDVTKALSNIAASDFSLQFGSSAIFDKILLNSRTFFCF